MGSSSIIQVCWIVLHQFMVLSMHTVSKIQTSLITLLIIAAVWKQIAGAVVCGWMKHSSAKCAAWEEMCIFWEVLPKIHHRQMLAQLLSTATEHNRNTDEFLKCLKLSVISRFNKIWTWQRSETSHLGKKMQSFLTQTTNGSLVLWTPVILSYLGPKALFT